MNNDFERHITEYSADLTYLCIHLCENYADAEDLFQDTCLKAFRHFKKYDRTKPFDKWLYSICINTYKNHLNSAYRRHKYEFDSEEEKMLFINSIPDADRRETGDYYELHRAIMDLPKKLRIVLVLFYFKEYSIKEISDIVHIPEGTVKSRLSSAKKALRRILEDEEQK